MSKRVLLLLAHPRKGSFTEAAANAYEAGLQEAGIEYKRTNLIDLDFNPNLTQEAMEGEFEPDLIEAREDMKWCTHLVLVTPVWWYSLPAIGNGFFERTLTPGYAFKYRKNIPFPETFMNGRSVRVIYVQGSPRWISELLMFGTFWRALKYATFVFCGFGPVRRTFFSSVATSTAQRREAWLARVRKLGAAGA